MTDAGTLKTVRDSLWGNSTNLQMFYLINLFSSTWDHRNFEIRGVEIMGDLSNRTIPSREVTLFFQNRGRKNSFLDV